jgi:membrane-bound metal-dependent hydrolase YbcI (DUF457 family)
MFIGHFGVAMAAKRVAPAASLGTLVLAAQLVDLIWPAMLLLGIEQVRIDPGITRVTPLDFVHYPYTHSLVASLAWGALLALVYGASRKDWRTAPWLAVLVVSHWVLDAIVHRPDLTLWPGGATRVGLGVWNSLPATLAVEFALFTGGAYLYLAATTARDRWGIVLFAAFVGVLALIYVAAVFGPPPPNVRAIAIAGLAGWLFVAWGYWIDRHRVPACAV